MKRTLFLWVLILSVTSTTAQSWEQLNDSIIQLSNQEKYKEALPFAVKALNLARSESGDSSTRYAVSLGNFGFVHTKLGNEKVAESLYKKSMALFGALITRYYNSGNYVAVASLCSEALAIIKKINGEEHPDYITILNNQAEMYRVLGNYSSAELIQKQVLVKIKKVYGEEDPLYSHSLNNLGVIYIDIGNYAFAEPPLKKALAIRKKTLGTEHPDYAASLNNLAELYRNLGNYEAAEPLLIECLRIIKKLYGEEHPHCMSSMNNLAVLYEAMEKETEAENLYRETTALRKKVLGQNHPDYATSLFNLATYYQKKGDYDTALVLFQESLEISRRVFGTKHPAYASCLNSIGMVARQIGNYRVAEEFYKKALEISRTVFGEENEDYTGTLINLALLSADMQKYKESEEYFTRGTNLALIGMLKNFNTLSENEKIKWLKTGQRYFEGPSSLLVTQQNPSASYLQQACTQQLQLKGLVLNDGIKILQAIRSQGDKQLIQLLNEWQNNKNFLAKQYSLPVGNRIRRLDSLENSTNEMEKQINLQSSVFRNSQQSLQAGFKEVQEQLKADEAALEFIRFKYYHKGWTDSILYAAYIIRANEPAPQFVILCEEKQLQRIFDSAGNTATSMVSSFYRGLEIKNRNAATLGKELYKLVWEPLEPYLKGIKRISYSPAGKLYSIAFHALPADSATVLMDKYELRQYSSTRQLAFRNSENQHTKPENITFFGNASFTMDSSALAKQKTGDENIAANIYIPRNRGSVSGTWSSLPGTAQEIKSIQKLFEQNNISSTSFTQTSASEENLKSLGGHSPQVLHIATHGFFLPETDKKKKSNVAGEENTYTLSGDPLLRSGLILAGGNYAWSGKTPVDGVEDGIATAYEISQLNLSNTELVVLSACETALGDIKGNEGVFGLQRAFKMAGVKKMIVSLWQVPDKETAELMTTFYTYWMKGRSINDSFAQAQADMRKKYAPFYWAAFVLVE